MRQVAPGDIVFSYCDTRIKAVAVRPIDHIAALRPFLPDRYSPLQRNGHGLQGVYLAEVPELMAQVYSGRRGGRTGGRSSVTTAKTVATSMRVRLSIVGLPRGIFQGLEDMKIRDGLGRGAKACPLPHQHPVLGHTVDAAGCVAESGRLWVEGAIDPVVRRPILKQHHDRGIHIAGSLRVRRHPRPSSSSVGTACYWTKTSPGCTGWRQDFMFRLTGKEAANLRSQFVISSSHGGRRPAGMCRICRPADDDGRSCRVKRRYTVLVERGPTSFGAYVPDLPGCVAVAKSRRAVLTLIAEAMRAHVAVMRADGEVVPKPVHDAVVVEVDDAPQISPIRVLREGTLPTR